MRRIVGLVALVLGGCAAGTAATSESPPKDGECAVRLPPRPNALPVPRPSPTPRAPDSRVVVHAEVPLEPLLSTLEQRVPRQLAEGRARVGPAGTVSYRVERGALSLRVTPSSLVIEAPARARAEACRGDDCYASCEPEARVVVEVPLMLRPDFRFQKTSVSATFTKGCKVRALGGLLTIDVTPTLQAQLEPELQEVARQVDQQLPELEPRIADAWQELAAPRDVPLGGCFVLQPFGVVQGPFSASRRALRARFAVLAHPELRTRCGAAPSVPPLPALVTDAELPNEGSVRLGMVTSLDAVARALEAAEPARVKHAEVTARGAEVDVQLELGGRICGDVGLRAVLDFRGPDAHVRLTQASLWPGEQERLAESELDPNALAGSARIAPLLSVGGFQTAAPSLASALSRPGVEVRATVSSARAAGAVARGDELVAWLEARGAVELRLEALPER